MVLEIDPLFLIDAARMEADARGVLQRMRTLAASREGDGLDEVDALQDAATSLGLTDELRDALLIAVEPLASCEVTAVQIMDAHGGMPTLRRFEERATIEVERGAYSSVLVTVRGLVQKLLEDVERTAVTLAIGLGGSGGCACGDELPEDAAPGPLFSR